MDIPLLLIFYDFLTLFPSPCYFIDIGRIIDDSEVAYLDLEAYPLETEQNLAYF